MLVAIKLIEMVSIAFKIYFSNDNNRKSRAMYGKTFS